MAFTLYFIEGHWFTLCTDHEALMPSQKLLISIHHINSEILLTCLNSPQTFCISRANKITADALPQVILDDQSQHPLFISSLELSALQSSQIDYGALAHAQLTDTEVHATRTAVTRLILHDLRVPDSTYTLLCEVSTAQPRPIVPKTWRRKIFDLIHGLSHPGIKMLRKLMTSRFVWHGMDKDVGNWSRTSLGCHQAKHQHIWASLQHGQLPNRHFKQLHVDVVGPLPVCQGMKYLFTTINHFTRWWRQFQWLSPQLFHAISD